MCGGLGTCIRPMLTCARVGQPVCDCDGITYSTPCFAASAGINLAHNGSCSR
ncbi:MAG: Kazal-type serine protease inhibitor family protein [Myxococcota bacterium]